MDSLKETGVTELFTYHLRSLYTGQDARVGTRHKIIDQFKPWNGE